MLAPAATAPGHWDILEAFPDSTGAREQWNALVASHGGGLFISWDFLQSWWRYYGEGRSLRIYRRFDRGQLTGALALFLETLAPSGLRVARLVGSDFTPSVPQILMPPGLLSDLSEKICIDLLDSRKVDALHFGPLSEANDTSRGFLQAITQRADGRGWLRGAIRSPHAVFDLPEAFEDYLQGLGPQGRQAYHRRQKSISRNLPLRLERVGGEEEFDRFRQMHLQQWRHQGRRGHFDDWPKALAFHRDLLARCPGDLRLLKLQVDGEAIAYEYGWAQGRTLTWLLAGRSLDPRWGRYSLGKTALGYWLEAAIGEGIRRIDAGPGHYDYKLEMGAREYALHSLLLVRQEVASSLRAQLQVAWSECFDSLYYKGWFLRLAPVLARWKIGSFPLLKHWIRSRI